MADTTTELEVLDEIVDVLGGQSGQYETVVPTLQQIRDLLGGGGGGGYNPSLSVGRADALTGSDSTAQWATRITAGSGAATVRSVQGAVVGWNQLIKLVNQPSPAFGVTITTNPATGLVSYSGTTTQGGGRNSYIATNIPWVAGHKYLFYDTINYATGNTVKWVLSDKTTSSYVVDITGGNIYTANTDHVCWIGKNFAGGGEVYDCSGYISLYDLTQMFGSGNEPSTVAEFEAMFPEAYYPYSAPTLKPVQIAGIASTDAQGGELDAIEWTAQTLRAAGSVADVLYSDHVDVKVGERAYQSGDESDATVRTDGTTTYYPLATPTTTPISPALPMTYRVQAGGSESIVVPAGEVSAAPVITVAEGESAGELVMDALACIATPDGSTATSSHAVNTYLTMQGKLYKVTSAIAVGETIKSGTNVTQTTVMDELIARTA